MLNTYKDLQVEIAVMDSLAADGKLPSDLFANCIEERLRWHPWEKRLPAAYAEWRRKAEPLLKQHRDCKASLPWWKKVFA